MYISLSVHYSRIFYDSHGAADCITHSKLERFYFRHFILNRRMFSLFSERVSTNERSPLKSSSLPRLNYAWASTFKTKLPISLLLPRITETAISAFMDWLPGIHRDSECRKLGNLKQVRTAVRWTTWRTAAPVFIDDVKASNCYVRCVPISACILMEASRYFAAFNSFLWN